VRLQVRNMLVNWRCCIGHSSSELREACRWHKSTMIGSGRFPLGYDLSDLGANNSTNFMRVLAIMDVALTSIKHGQRIIPSVRYTIPISGDRKTPYINELKRT
jgi:hypothetical protein